MNKTLFFLEKKITSFVNLYHPRFGKKYLIENDFNEFRITSIIVSKEPPLKTVALVFRLDPKGHNTHFEPLCS